MGVLPNINPTDLWSLAVDKINGAIDAIVTGISRTGKNIELTKSDGSTIDVDLASVPDGVVSGAALSQNAADQRKFNIAAGTIFLKDNEISVAGQTLSITNGDPSDPRVDVLAVDTNGAFKVFSGVAGEQPQPPAVPSGNLAVGVVYIEAGATDTLEKIYFRDLFALSTAGIYTRFNNDSLVLNSNGSTATQGAQVRQDVVTQTLTNNAFQPVVLDAVNFDIGGFWDNSVFVGSTATSATSNTLTDTGESWTVDEWAGYVVRITGGTGAGQVRRISSNTADTLTLAFPNWGTTPDATSTYEITLQNRFTIPAGQSGEYMVSARATFSASASGLRGVAIYNTGVFKESFFNLPVGTVESPVFYPNKVYFLDEGEYIEFDAYQSSGGDLDLLSIGERIYLQITKIN